jgi:hypothetical protein
VRESFLITTKFVTQVELKDLTSMFCSLVSSYKVYKEGAFFFYFTFKIMWHLGWAQRSLTLKAKHKIK